MDYLSLLENKDLIDISESLVYPTQFTLAKLFNQRKTRNLFAEARLVSAQDRLPRVAQVHAFDSESRIGSRPNYSEIKFEKLFIKEKINRTEKMMYLLDEYNNDKLIKDYIFNDVENLNSKVVARTEVMHGELLSTGKITVKENNLDFEVDYGMDSSNKVQLTNWKDPDHDILGDLEAIKTKASYLGINIVRAITSTKIITLMTKNNTIKEFLAKLSAYPSQSVVKSYIKDVVGIEFITDDEVYFDDDNKTTRRFFDENAICFVPTEGVVGEGLWGVTPEELSLIGSGAILKGFTTVTEYKDTDSCAIWTKVSGVYLPVVRDINSLIIAKVNS